MCGLGLGVSVARVIQEAEGREKVCWTGLASFSS